MENEKLFNKGFIFFALMQTVNFILFYMMYPIIPKYAQDNGISLSIIGIISGAATLGAFITRPFGGYSMDHLNKKACIMVSYFICGISVLLIPVSVNPVYLSAIRVLYGMSFAFSSIAITSCAADNIPRDRMGRGIGYVGLGTALAAAIGPALGLSLSESMGYKTMYYIIGAVTLVCVVGVPFFSVKNPKKPETHEKLTLASFFTKDALLFAVFVFPLAFSAGFVSSFISLLSEDISSAAYIQQSMLPVKFEKTKAVDLAFLMDPAKVVGGDFYDFFYIDENHMVFLIADVSGKGIRAGIYMADAKTQIKQYMRMGVPMENVLRLVGNNLRLENCLKDLRHSSPEELTAGVRASVESFEEDAEPFDDKTMLVVEYTGVWEQTIPAEIKSIRPVIRSMKLHMEENSADPSQMKKALLAAEELIANVCMYAYPQGEGSIYIRQYVNEDMLVLELIDDGIPYNPLERETPDFEERARTRKVSSGGLGIYIAKQFGHNIEYRYENDQNILTVYLEIRKENENENNEREE